MDSNVLSNNKEKRARGDGQHLNTTNAKYGNKISGLLLYGETVLALLLVLSSHDEWHWLKGYGYGNMVSRLLS